MAPPDITSAYEHFVLNRRAAEAFCYFVREQCLSQRDTVETFQKLLRAKFRDEAGRNIEEEVHKMYFALAEGSKPLEDELRRLLRDRR